MKYSPVYYGNMAEVVRDDSFVIVRLTGEHADTEAFVVAGALNDAYNQGKRDTEATYEGWIEPPF